MITGVHAEEPTADPANGDRQPELEAVLVIKALENWDPEFLQDQAALRREQRDRRAAGPPNRCALKPAPPQPPRRLPPSAQRR